MEELARQFCHQARQRSGLRYSQELRQTALAYARHSERSGRSRQEIAEALCLSEATLVRWLEGSKESAPLHEVVVVDSERLGAPVLVMPSGVRVEGLSLPELVSVLEALG
jgi:predicted transcriptional regulator